MDISELKVLLKRAIRSASDEVLHDIARYDNHGGGGVTYEEACALHFDGLKDLIDRCDCEPDWPRHYWYPMEAVELRAFVPEGGDPLSFGVAVSLLMLDDLLGNEKDHMAARSSDGFLAAYRALPEAYSKPILTGLERLDQA